MVSISERKREAVIRDLERLYAEIPELVAAIQAGDDLKTEEAIALVTKGSAGRFQVLEDRLINMVLAECEKGNYRPLQRVASGEVFR